MPRPIAKEFVGEVVEAVIADAFSYEPTCITLIYADERRVQLVADSIMYDQYSSSPCLTMRIENA